MPSSLLDTKDWPVASLGDVISLEYGRSLPKAKRDSSGEYVVAGSNGSNGQHSEYLVDGPGIVVGRKGSAGKITWYSQPFWPIDTTYYVRPKAVIDLRWCKYLLESLRLEDLVAGAAVPGLSREDAYRRTCRLPPLDEQSRIAAILDKADAIRRKRQEAIQLTEELLRSAFLEMFGDPVTNPKGWPLVPLGKLCRRVVDCAHSTPRYSEDARPYPCVRSSDIQAGYFDWSSTKTVSERTYEMRTKRHTPVPGDVVFCREGARFGNAARVPEGHTICLGQRMMIFQAMEGTSTPEYLWSLLNLSQEAFRRIAGGTATPRVNIKDLVGLKVMRPVVEEQMRFSDIVGSTDRNRRHDCRALEKGGDLFNSLVQRAFRGEL